MTMTRTPTGFSVRGEAADRPEIVVRYEVWFLVAILVFAAAIRFLRLSEGTLWLDESASWWFASQSWSYLWDILPKYETNPPYYYMMLKAWMGLAGTGEIALRIPSAIASTLVVYLMFVSGRIVGGARCGWPLGLMAALTCAVWIFQIGTAVNARGYAFSALGLAMLMAGCLQLMVYSRESAGRVPHLLDGVAGNTKAFMAIGLGSALALMTHFLAAVSVGLVGVFLLAWWAIRHRGDRRLLLSLAMSAAVILVIYGPYLPKLLTLVLGGAGDLSGIAFLEKPSFRWLVGLTSLAFGQHSFELGDAQVLVDTVLIALGCVGFWRLTRRLGQDQFWVVGLLVLLTAVVWLTLVAVTYLIQPVLMPRSLIFAQVPLLLLIAAAPWAVPSVRMALSVGLVAYVGIGAARPLEFILPAQRTYDTMVEVIAGSDAPDVPVITIPYLLETGLLYYEEKSGVVLNRRSYPAPFELPNQPIPMIDAERAQSIVDGLSGESTVWVLVRRLADYDPSGELYGRLEAAGFTRTVVVRGAELEQQETLNRFDRVEVNQGLRSIQE